jgi:hypothetical protein
LLPFHPFFEPFALTLFVFSQGWVAAEKVFSDERRLLSIENELAIAREIQNSIQCHLFTDDGGCR